MMTQESERRSFSKELEDRLTPRFDPHKLISPARVRELCGGVSDMSLWRWLNDPTLNFPKPIYIGRQRYWREVQVRAWIDDRPLTGGEEE